MTNKANANKRPMIAPTAIRGTVLASLMLLTLLVGGIGYWVIAAPLASAVVASGFVTVDGHRKALQHADGGAVKQLLVRDGDLVASGQALIELDDATPLASYNILRASFDTLMATKARLNAEQNGADEIYFPASLTEGQDREIAELLKSQQSLFEARRNSINGERGILEQRIIQLDEEIGGMTAQREAKTKQLELLGEELAGLRSLFEKGHASRPRMLALERESAKLDGERGEIIAQSSRARTSAGETRLQILQLQNKFQEKVAAELREVETKLSDTAERLAAAQAVLQRIVIRAPVSGTVVGMTVHNSGAFVSQGQTVAEIVPTNDALIVEAKIRPADIDNLAIGSEAEVRIIAFHQRTTSPLKGHFAFISADKLIDQLTSEPYFRAHINVPKASLEAIGDKKLLPGMPAEVIIKTGTRTALDYVIDPIAVSMNRAWREK